MSKYLIQKNSSGATLKDVDVKNGVITGYFASFDTLDSDGDVFTKGAFKKSINENSNRIMHLLQHDVLKPIGRPEVLREDTKGLYFETKLNSKQLEVSYIKDTLKLYEAGVFNEHSVGFITMQEHKGNKGGNSVNFISEAKLMEGSTVTWGANENTPYMGLKSLTKDNINDRIDKVCKALKIGELSDDLFIKLEIELQSIKTFISQLKQPSEDTADIITEKANADVVNFLKQLKI
jgi:hypothetical protein